MTTYQGNGNATPFGAHTLEKYDTKFSDKLVEGPDRKKRAVKFLITAPPFTKKSAGIRCLHELCNDLIKLGYDATLILMTGSEPIPNSYLANEDLYFSNELSRNKIQSDNELADYLNNGVTIYPEIVTGNPLGAKNVVRYFLNKEAAINGKMVYAEKRDFILSYSKKFHSNANAYLGKIFKNEKCNDLGTLPTLSRGLDVTYIGKGLKETKCVVIPNTIEITREYPRSQNELFLLLRNTRFYFTWDPLSATNADAVRCGAIPVILNFLPFSESEIDELEQGAFPRAIYRFDSDLSFVVTVPDDYFDKRKTYLKMADVHAAHYEENLSKVFSQIENHFNKLNLNTV